MAGGTERERRLPTPASPGAVCVSPRTSVSAAPEVQHGARGGRCGSPLVICQHFPLRVGGEMGADPCPQAEAGPTAPRRCQVGPLPPHARMLHLAASLTSKYTPLCTNLTHQKNRTSQTKNARSPNVKASVAIRKIAFYNLLMLILSPLILKSFLLLRVPIRQ